MILLHFKVVRKWKINDQYWKLKRVDWFSDGRSLALREEFVSRTGTPEPTVCFRELLVTHWIRFIKI